MASSSRLNLWNRALDRIGVNDPLDSEEDDRPEAAACARHYDDILKEVLESLQWPWATRQRPLTEVTDQVTTTAYADVTDAAKKRIPVAYAFLDASQLEVVKVAASGVKTTLTLTTHYTVTLADPDAGSGPEAVLIVALGVGESITVTVASSRVGWAHLYELPTDCVTPIALLYGGQRFWLTAVASRLEHVVMVNDGGDGGVLCCNVGPTEFDALEYVALVAYVPLMSAHFIDCMVWRLARELALTLKKDRALAAECRGEFLVAIDVARAYALNVGHNGDEPMTPGRMARG